MMESEFAKEKFFMSSEARIRELVDVQPSPESKKSRFARFYAQIKEKECEGIRSNNELNLYLLENTEYLENESILKWWQNNTNKYPILSNIGRKFLAVPITSISVDKFFLTAPDILTCRRQSLNSQSVKMTIFLKE
ncbi:hypothetical protein A3Q56_06311 [Intoshia linei]|uniref:HAT C-terminal dimerisation domain-containing protein n=1 Tax=Intoshia linei TaxID=1819745 RepID=A0A177AVE5_9BILA|nr:hypothetical protein A3Q56_06311 [Intoshia linei]